MNPTTRATAVTIFLSGVGIWSVLFHNVSWDYSIPHIIFYAVLSINTFFSVKFYSAITPPSAFQTCIDLALAAGYVALALSIGLPLSFAFFALFIFAIAPAKYTHMLLRTPHDKTLKKKILIDLLGTLMCVGILGLTLLGLELKAAWILAILFTLANVYLLAIKPMYQHI